MWFLNFIPDAWIHLFIHCVVALGLLLYIAGTIEKYVPFFSKYSIPFKFIGGIILLVGIFFEGGYGVEMSWRARAAQLQKQIDIAQRQSTEANQKLAVALKNTKVIVKEKVRNVYTQVESNRNAINSDCKLNDTAWMLYNRAVEPPQVSGSTPSTTSTFTGSKTSSTR